MANRFGPSWAAWITAEHALITTSTALPSPDEHWPQSFRVWAATSVLEITAAVAKTVAAAASTKSPLGHVTLSTVREATWLIPPAIVLGAFLLIIGNIVLYRMVNFKF